MKVVILAGGLGSRLAEETALRPKPMVEIGGKPILWHIMKIYSAHGLHDFVICLGYKGYLIKEYFANYFVHMSDITFHISENRMEVHQKKVEPWRVTLVDTGDQTMTGGRLKAVRKYVDDEDFCFTYGDGVGDVDITREIAFHQAHRKHATMCTVHPPGRFGSVRTEGDRVAQFVEKPLGDGGLINGGFFVLSPAVFEYIDGPDTIWEQHSLYRLADDQQLMAFRHDGFWQPMDTLREKNLLEKHWADNTARWKVWA